MKVIIKFNLLIKLLKLAYLVYVFVGFDEVNAQFS